MPAILFVCTANICRSPMAMGLFRKMLEEKHTPGTWMVESAGTWGLDGDSAAAGSQAVMRNLGIDIADHRARSVNYEIIQSADLVLTMENGHKEALRMEFPEFSDNILLLSEMVNQKQDIDDPYGGAFSEYEQAAEDIEGYLNNGFDTIISNASPTNSEPLNSESNGIGTI